MEAHPSLDSLTMDYSDAPSSPWVALGRAVKDLESTTNTVESGGGSGLGLAADDDEHSLRHEALMRRLASEPASRDDEVPYKPPSAASPLSWETDILASNTRTDAVSEPPSRFTSGIISSRTSSRTSPLQKKNSKTTSRTLTSKLSQSSSRQGSHSSAVIPRPPPLASRSSSNRAGTSTGTATRSAAAQLNPPHSSRPTAASAAPLVSDPDVEPTTEPLPNDSADLSRVQQSDPSPRRSELRTAPAPLTAMTAAYCGEDDPTMRRLLAHNPTIRMLHVEAELNAKAAASPVSSSDLLVGTQGGEKAASPRGNRSSSSPTRTMDLRFSASEAAAGVFSYDALDDVHCSEFWERSKTFQKHWMEMLPHTKPNHRVHDAVRAAMQLDLQKSPRRGSSAAPSRRRTDGRERVAALRECLCFDVAHGTSVAVLDAVTFIAKRREDFAAGLPEVLKRPNDAFAVQMHGRAGTMNASAGEPWPPTRVGSASKKCAPPPNSAPAARLLSSAGSARAGVVAPSTPHSRPSTAGGALARLHTLCRPASSSTASFPLRPQRGGSAKYDARSPFLDGEMAFTSYDAQFFLDRQAMVEGTAPPSPYYFTGSASPRRRSTPQHRQNADAAARLTPTSSDAAAVASSSLDILTETRIGVVAKCEDYNRRELLGSESLRFTRMRSDFLAKKTFFVHRQRQVEAIVDSERTMRDEVVRDESQVAAKIQVAMKRDLRNAKMRQEVFPLCAVLRKGDSKLIESASEHSIIVDLRWCGGDEQSAALAILVFDELDRYVVTVKNGESLRCPASGKPVIRSWGNFKFRPLEESAALMIDGRAFSPAESRSTFELLLHNLSPEAHLARFVFVVVNPITTGASLSPIHRGYLTVREPQEDQEASLIATSFSADRPRQMSTTTTSTSTSNSAGRRKVQTDTRVSEIVACRLMDFPPFSCYTVASVRRCVSFSALAEMSSQFGSTVRGQSPQLRSLVISPRADGVSSGDRVVTEGSIASVGSTSSSLWSFHSHDFLDSQASNLLRLPFILQATLFMSESDIWSSYWSAVFKTVRLSDEFYEKIQRASIELSETRLRSSLLTAMAESEAAIYRQSALNPLAAAMLKVGATALVRKPKGTPSKSVARKSNVWLGLAAAKLKMIGIRGSKERRASTVPHEDDGESCETDETVTALPPAAVDDSQS